MGTAGIVLGVIRLIYGYKTKGNLKYWASASVIWGRIQFLNLVYLEEKNWLKFNTNLAHKHWECIW